MKIKLLLISTLSFGLLSACSDMQTATTPVKTTSPPPSYASTECGRNFAVSGDPRNGATYTAFAKFSNLDVRSAIGQVEKIAVDQGLQVGADQFDSGFGRVQMVVKDPNGGDDFPLLAAAQKSTGRLALVAKMNRGQIVSDSLMRDRMCDMLSKVKMDAAGASAAAATQKKLGSGQITDIKAVDLALEFGEALRAKQDNTQIATKYYGRVYRIDGQVSRPTDGMGMYGELQMASTSKSFNIPYITQVHAGILGIGQMTSTPVQIMCRTAPDQYSRFIGLHNGDYATLIGTVTNFNGKTRSKSLFVDNPLTTTGSILADQSYGGILNLDCRFEK